MNKQAMEAKIIDIAILGDAREKKAKEEGVSLRNYKYCADSEKNDNLVHF